MLRCSLKYCSPSLLACPQGFSQASLPGFMSISSPSFSSPLAHSSSNTLQSYLLDVSSLQWQSLTHSLTAFLQSSLERQTLLWRWVSSQAIAISSKAEASWQSSSPSSAACWAFSSPFFFFLFLL